MARRRRPWEVEDELWELIEPLLPHVARRSRYPGRKRIDDRLCLQGILFVLYTGIGWCAARSAGPAGGRPWYSPTGATTTTSTGAWSAPSASDR